MHFNKWKFLKKILSVHNRTRQYNIQENLISSHLKYSSFGHLIFGQLQCTQHEGTLKEHLEASAGADCGRTTSLWNLKSGPCYTIVLKAALAADLLLWNKSQPPLPPERACYRSHQSNNSGWWGPGEDPSLLWPQPFGTSWPPMWNWTQTSWPSPRT